MKSTWHFRFGVFEFDPTNSDLRRSGHSVRLQQQPLQLLHLLLENAGSPVSRDELRLRLWPAELVVDFDRNLNKAMNKLRHALGDTADSPRYIQTVHRVGYRFIAPVQKLSDVPTEAAEANEPAALAEVDIIPAPAEVAKASAPLSIALLHRPGPAGRWMTGSLAIVLIAFAMGFLGTRLHVRASPVQTAAPLRQSLAVLGFRNLSNRPDEAWLDTALSDWLSVDLASTGQLRTISADSVDRAKKDLHIAQVESLNPDALKKMGTLLGTDYVVVGDYGLVGNSPDREIRLDLRLQDVHTGEQVALFSETGVETNLFGLVAGVSEQLRDRFHLARLPLNQQNAVAMALPGSPEAARLYSQALQALRLMDARRAAELLGKSIAIEPKRALSHMAMATAWEQLGYDGHARDEAKTAYSLADGLPCAEHLRVEGRYAVLSKDWKRAIEVYRALVEFYPDSLDDGLELAGAQIRGGDGRSALATIAAFSRLPSPLGNDPRLDLAEAGAAESQGDYRRDLAAAERAAGKASAQGATLLLAQALADESWAMSNLGQQQQARASSEHSLALFTEANDPRGVALDTGIIGVALLDQGDAAGAKEKFEQALRIHKTLGGVLSVAGAYDNMGDAQMALADFDGARTSYEHSLEAYRTIGHADGLALVNDSLGMLLIATGNLPQGMKYLNAGLKIARQIGDQSKTNDILSHLGDGLRLQGDLDGSQRRQEEALAGFDHLGNKSGAAHAHVDMAKLLLDRGSPQRAVHESELASTEYGIEHNFAGGALADAVLARALLAEGNSAQAGKALASAQRAVGHSDRVEAKLAVMLSAWLCKPRRDGKPKALADEREFQHIVVAAGKRGLVTFVSEAHRQATALGS